MRKNPTILSKAIGFLVLLCAAEQAMPQATTISYPKMAPVDQYLMPDKNVEVALARSAAPDSISSGAEVLVLGRNGFETAVGGKNGFVCFVGRGWTSAADPDFWNPNVRVPMCLNAAAAHSYLTYITKITSLGLSGHTLTEVNKIILTAIAAKELPPMEAGAMCYMMSKEGYGGEIAPHWPSHLMFFYTNLDPAIWGANLPGSPVIGVMDPDQHFTEFVIPTKKWSDGSDDLSQAPHNHAKP